MEMLSWSLFGGGVGMVVVKKGDAVHFSSSNFNLLYFRFD